jgi:hypothetical protein
MGRILLITAGLALAITTGAGAAQLITGRQVKDGTLTGRDIRNRSIKPQDLSRSARVSGPQGVQGVPGPAGARGAAGPAGRDATALWAVVNANGTLSRGEGVKNVSRAGAGLYDVTFTEDVAAFDDESACAFVGAVSGTGGLPAFGFLSASKLAGSPNVVFVKTLDTSGAVEDEPFHLAVFC